MVINHRELLKKYMSYVGEWEGVNFVSGKSTDEYELFCGATISTEEFEELQKMAEEVIYKPIRS